LFSAQTFQFANAAIPKKPKVCSKPKNDVRSRNEIFPEASTVSFISHPLMEASPKVIKFYRERDGM
jgi:hypothetical protein